MTKLRVLDLFSGIGGFSLGLERTGGFETVAFCEIDSFCQRVLRKHWPDVPIYDDVRRLNYGHPVDVVTAGFPCQDISFAGQGAGLAGKRSGLFWRVIRTVCMVGRPRLLLENVAALLGRGMGDVLGALATIRYDAEWDCLQACDVGLPHRRLRVFITAHPYSLRKLQPGWGIRDQRGRLLHGLQETIWTLPYCGGNRARHGFSKRLDGLGNAVVPQIPELIGHAILKAEMAV